MSEVQGEVNITVYRNVYMRYWGREMFQCTVMFYELQFEGNVTV